LFFAGDDNSGVKVHWEGDYVMTASIETDEDTYVIEVQSYPP